MLTGTDWAAIMTAAEKLGIPRETARSWRKLDRQIPAGHVPSLAAEAGIPEYKMRPDVWRRPGKAA